MEKLKEKVPYRMNCRTLYCHHKGKLLDHATKNVFKSLKDVILSLVSSPMLHWNASTPVLHISTWGVEVFGVFCFAVLGLEHSLSCAGQVLNH